MKRNIFIHLLSSLPFIGVLFPVLIDSETVKLFMSYGFTRNQAIRTEYQLRQQGIDLTGWVVSNKDRKEMETGLIELSRKMKF